jgi:hypothetical protein
MKSETIYFVSNEFQIVPGEEKETNPGVFGKQLAFWLKNIFVKKGYSELVILPEDWGWCLILERKPNLLWVGCSGHVGLEFSTEYFEENEKGITWSCFVVMEAPFLKKLLGKANYADTLINIKKILIDALDTNQDICIVKETW